MFIYKFINEEGYKMIYEYLLGITMFLLFSYMWYRLIKLTIIDMNEYFIGACLFIIYPIVPILIMITENF
jgi:hypothetical protein